MGKKPEFTWDETSGICSCAIVLDDILHGFGIAQCADEDKDIFNERVGMHIAELRAQINLLQNYKNYELRPGLKALLHLKGTMIRSKKYNADSYESKRLNVEIKNFRKDIEDINDAITAAKQNLYEYINIHEKLAKRIRENDHKGYDEADTERIVKEIEFFEKVINNDSKT